MLTGSEIRRKFLDFFVQKGHKEVHSSSLVPANDPTLLFTNAGMNQFKDVFLGAEQRGYVRATTSQKCVRAGGKHNDLENVGFTNRHHTFFEMLGNFSFGDYFKKDAIAYAWELITSPQWFGIDKGKLYVTIFKGENGVERDAEAYELWAEQGIAKDRIFELGSKDNFWQMGDTGPCGPCSEIHYDMGPAASDRGHTDCKFGCECGRYVEIWNLVFMQFDRDSSGKLTPLPKPSIDTGAGLERITTVLQRAISNYQTDLFIPLINRTIELVVMPNPGGFATPDRQAVAASWRVIADHARAATFLISDGVLPSNEGRGYVLRKIIRRAIRHGRAEGASNPFFYQMAFAVVDLMKNAYPELLESKDRVAEVIRLEENRFAHTLDIGLKRLEDDIRAVFANSMREREFPRSSSPEAIERNMFFVFLKNHGLEKPVYPGADAFKLYDTFGLPLDFIQDVARDQGLLFDDEGFDRAMAEQRDRARASWKGAAKQTANPVYQSLPKSEFEGYRQTGSSGCEVLAILKAGQGVQELGAGEEGEIILDHTPFYAESGGQVGDRGLLYSEDGNMIVAEVRSCYAPVQGVRAHKVLAKQAIRVGQKVNAVVDADIRRATMRHHTATHLLHAALRETLGKHVKQAGSLVDAGHLRFDFSHFAAVEDEELQDVEDIINKEVLRNTEVKTIADVPIDQAISEYKAMALFGEKYGDKVRVVRIGDFSTELCGGTHTGATGEIGLIKILSEGSVSSGVRRIEAVAGERSLEHFRQDYELGKVVAGFVKSPPSFAQNAKEGRGTHSSEGSKSPAEALRAELEKKDSEIKRLQKELDQVRMKSASSTVASVEDKIKVVKGVKVLAHRVDNLERAQLRTLVDQLRDKIGSGVVVLGSAGEGGVSLIVCVTKDLVARVQAGKVIASIAQKVGGKGGGRPDMAEAGGKDVAALDGALAEVYEVVGGLLG